MPGRVLRDGLGGLVAASLVAVGLLAAAPHGGARAPVLDLQAAASDTGEGYSRHCKVLPPFTARRTCTVGDGPTQVALVGNSHAAMWLPALREVARREHWTITTYLVSVCNVSDAPTGMPTLAVQNACSSYARWAFTQTAGRRYDLVITSERQSNSVAGHSWARSHDPSQQGYESILSRWSASGARVLVIKDPVNPPDVVGKVPACLAKHPGDVSRCTWSHQQTEPRRYRWMDPLTDAARAAHVPVVDLDDLLCPGGTCQPVVGGVVTFFDASHLTATYSRRLAPALRARIAKALA